MTNPFGARFRLRVAKPGAEPELRCPACGEWLAITAEFWRLNAWSECRACFSERQALYAALRRRRDPVFRATEIERSRRYRKWLRETAPALVATYDRERRVRHARWQRERRARAA